MLLGTHPVTFSHFFPMHNDATTVLNLDWGNYHFHIIIDNSSKYVCMTNHHVMLFSIFLNFV